MAKIRWIRKTVC